MPKYAAATSVSVEKSKAEIERTLQRYGATQFAYGWDQKRAMIGFHHTGRAIRIALILPDKQQFARTPAGKRERKPDAMGAGLSSILEGIGSRHQSKT